MVIPETSRPFRLDNERLAFRFTATVSDRATPAPRERVPSPESLHDWLVAVGLGPGRSVTAGEWRDALRLREAIHRWGTATALGRPGEDADRTRLNTAVERGRVIPRLGTAGRGWVLRESDPVADALAVIAFDAIELYGTESAARVTRCEGEGCAGLFLDTSRGGNRRWCSMNTCGNRAKKARLGASRHMSPVE